MMSYEMVMELLASLGADVEVDTSVDGSRVYVTVMDFEGIDEEGEEIDRDLEDEELVRSVREQLEESALSVSGSLGYDFAFDGFTIVWRSASLDL